MTDPEKPTDNTPAAGKNILSNVPPSPRLDAEDIEHKQMAAARGLDRLRMHVQRIDHRSALLRNQVVEDAISDGSSRANSRQRLDKLKERHQSSVADVVDMALDGAGIDINKDKESSRLVKRITEISIKENNRKIDDIYVIIQGLDKRDNGDAGAPSVHSRLELLLDFSQRRDESEVLDYARALFPNWFQDLAKSADGMEHSATALPSEAPEIYQGLRGPETPPAFVQRVYSPWLGKGLDRAHIRQLDPTLSKAIDNWSRKNEWPSEVDLPTRGEQNRRFVEQLSEQAPDGKIGRVLGEFTAREAGRIRSAIQRKNEKDR